MLTFLISLLHGFAWAIGGEKHFGKWRRGILVSIPCFLMGLVVKSHWWYYLSILAAFWPVFQSLFYDIAIKMIYPDTGTTSVWSKILGWTLNFVNGFIVGTMPALLFYSNMIWINGLVCQALCGLFFCWAVFQSNSLKLQFDIDIRIGEVKIFCLKDTWWFACWVFGILSGLTYFLY